MRQRRINRLLARARVAREDGRDEEANAALAEVEQLGGDQFPLSEPEIRTPPDPTPDGDPPLRIVFSGESGDSLAAFDNEGETLIEEWTSAAPGNDLLDLPLYPQLAGRSQRRRRRTGPRVAAVLAAGVVVFWFAPPPESQLPATAIAEGGSPVSAPPQETPVAAEPAITEQPPLQLAVTEVPAYAATPADVEYARPATSPPVSLAGVDVVEPRATSPQPVTRPEPAATRSEPTVPAPTTVEAPPPPAPLVTVPVASGAPLEGVGSTEAAPAPPPVETMPDPVPSSPPAAPAASSATTLVPPASVAAAGVRAALLRYESGYSRLDVDAVSAVWPAIDRRALARAFDGLSSQKVTLGSCEVRIVGESAIAECAGSATWTPKVGSGSHKQTRQWQFRLRNVDSGWQIVSATVR
jgi:hypothetical protein